MMQIEKKLQGLVPFNAFWFKNCYLHCVAAIYPYLGLEIKQLLGSVFDIFDGRKFATNPMQCAEAKDIWLANVNKETIISCINENKPLSVGVDCYYLSAREDCYLKKHNAHFVVVFGYNLQKEIWYCIEHSYINGLTYTEKEIAFDELCHACEGFEKHFSGESRETSAYLVRTNDAQPFSFAKLGQLLLEEEERLYPYITELFTVEENPERLINLWKRIRERDNILLYLMQESQHPLLEMMREKSALSNHILGMLLKGNFVGLAKVYDSIMAKMTLYFNISHTLHGGLV